jgi:hypothetical protein
MSAKRHVSSSVGLEELLYLFDTNVSGISASQRTTHCNDAGMTFPMPWPINFSVFNSNEARVLQISQLFLSRTIWNHTIYQYV